MATDTLVPTSVVSSSGLIGATTGNLNADDGTYATAASSGTSGNVQVGFDTPTGPPNTGAGLQTFNAKCRKSTASEATPTGRLELWEAGGGSALATGSETNITSDSTDSTVTLTWDATLLGMADGSAVEARLVFTHASGGGGGAPSSVNTDYIEWVVDYNAIQTLEPTLFTNTQTFYNATVRYDQALAPALFTNTQTFFAASVQWLLTAPLLTNEQTFYSAEIRIKPTFWGDNRFNVASIRIGKSRRR